MKISEIFALNQWLSDYPDDMTYEEIITALKVDNQQWRIIEDTKDAFEQATADQPTAFIGD